MTPRSLDELFEALSRSKFRSRFRLNAKDAAYLADRGIDMVLEHAEAFLQQRLAPAQSDNDGRQTPMRGHPAFVAQHATAICCRSCLAKWHRIPAGKALIEPEIEYLLGVLRRWLDSQPRPPHAGRLFPEHD